MSFLEKPFRSTNFTQGLILSTWDDRIGPKVVKFWGGNEDIPQSVIDILSKNTLDSDIFKQIVAKHTETKINILQNPRVFSFFFL
jgi:hypothetical protein